MSGRSRRFFSIIISKCLEVGHHSLARKIYCLNFQCDPSRWSPCPIPCAVCVRQNEIDSAGFPVVGSRTHEWDFRSDEYAFLVPLHDLGLPPFVQITVLEPFWPGNDRRSLWIENSSVCMAICPNGTDAACLRAASISPLKGASRWRNLPLRCPCQMAPLAGTQREKGFTEPLRDVVFHENSFSLVITNSGKRSWWVFFIRTVTAWKPCRRVSASASGAAS